MSTHRAAQVKSAGGPLEVVEVETSATPAGHVRIDVKACGVCGTDHGGHRVIGHPSGTAADIEDTMNFAVLSGVRPRIEEMPLADAAAAYAKMDDGSARYRMVLTM